MAKEKMKLISLRDEQIDQSKFKVLVFRKEDGKAQEAWLTPKRFEALGFDFSGPLAFVDDLPVLEVVTDVGGVGQKAVITGISILA